MLNYYDKQILELEEQIYNLKKHVSILQSTKKSLILDLDQTEDELRELEGIMKHSKTEISLSYNNRVLKLSKGDDILYLESIPTTDFREVYKSIFKALHSVVGLNNKSMDYAYCGDNICFTFTAPKIDNNNLSYSPKKVDLGELNMVLNSLYANSPYVVSVNKGGR